ncbi:MAG: hypothetical protein KAJ19_27010 [Gammaproteobacteria bacterium]|nr:hypothetical protein [Gammaproteobacteria bacterium]
MPVVSDRYRGQIIYHLVYNELITAARYRGTVTYQEIAQMMGLAITGQNMGTQVGHILSEISEDEGGHDQPRPMLSAVAVRVSGEPGDGFYTLARQLGKIGEDATTEQKKTFWKNEKKLVYETWQTPLY